MIDDTIPTCDVCGTECEALPGDEWCGECGCCVEHCQEFVGCEAERLSKLSYYSEQRGGLLITESNRLRLR